MERRNTVVQMRAVTIIAVCLAPLALAACQGAGNESPTMPVSSFLRPLRLTDTNLYVANSGGKTSSPGSVTIYGLKRGKLLGALTDGVDRPSAIGYDAAANLIAVANAQPQEGEKSGSVVLYAPGSKVPTNVLKGTADPVSLAFDDSGKVYVADFNGGINIYAPNQSRPVRRIPGNGSSYDGVLAPRMVALDGMRNVYVANGPFPVGSSDNVFALSVFPPGKSEANVLVEIGHPRALLVAGDRVYVAYGSTRHGRNPYGTVVVFPLDSSFPAMTIKQGLHTPDALAVDASANLYVANLNGGNVAVYRPGSTSPFRTITNGVHFPKALAIGPQGNLYVSNLYENTVTVYKPDRSTPFLTIRLPVGAPVALTLNAPSPSPSSDVDRASSAIDFGTGDDPGVEIQMLEQCGFLVGFILRAGLVEELRLL